MGILESVPVDVKSVEFTPDGYWRIKQGDCSAMPINRSSENSDQGNNVVIDLTFDTPEKAVQKKFSNAGSNCGIKAPPVIDLTLSP